MRRLAIILLALSTWSAACGEDDPAGSPDAAHADAAADAIDAGAETDAAADAAPAADAGPACAPLATDYQPRANSSADDEWPACISDDNLYHPFDENISSVARVAAFESIVALLLDGPVAQDFIDARLTYLEPNGLESRVARREDEHYPPAPMACRDLTPEDVALYPDRCVGPARIQPLLNAAFQAGAEGTDLPLNAARVEAGLLWFLYVSVYKEGFTCTQVVADCDSSYAYYGGGEPRAGGLGLARHVRALAADTHDRIWDGVLAVRCWRDLDNPIGIAENLAQRDQALRQLDVALLHGVTQIVRDRVADLAAAGGPAEAAVPWAFLEVLGPVLDREASERDADAAAVLRAEFAKADPADVDTAALLEALEALFPCP